MIMALIHLVKVNGAERLDTRMGYISGAVGNVKWFYTNQNLANCDNNK